jgi:hypothetical protein
MAAVTIVAGSHFDHQNRIVQCADHLSTLYRIRSEISWPRMGWKMGSLRDRYMNASGKEHWVMLGEVIATEHREGTGFSDALLFCPAKVRKPSAATDYLGPRCSPNRLQPDEPLGCDESGNHPLGGNVIFKSGRVAQMDHSEYERWRERCSP